MREARTADPSYALFTAPEDHEAPWTFQDPLRRRANRRRRDGVKAAFPSTGQLTLNFRRFVVGGEVADPWSNIGGMSAMPRNSACRIDLSAVRFAEKGPRGQEAQNEAWAHLVRESCILDVVRDELPTGTMRGLPKVRILSSERSASRSSGRLSYRIPPPAPPGWASQPRPKTPERRAVSGREMGWRGLSSNSPIPLPGTLRLSKALNGRTRCVIPRTNA